MNEWKRQELAEKLIERDVYYCVSSLMSGIAHIMFDCRNFYEAFMEWPEDLLSLYQEDDWKESGEDFINTADLDELGIIADQFGYWSDIVDTLPHVYSVPISHPPLYCFSGASRVYENELDAENARDEKHLPIIRENVAKLVDDWQWVANEFKLDSVRYEAYEHWLVSDWLADELKRKGEIVGDFAGLTIWGRCATGQTISLDRVIQDIAIKLWGDE